MSIFQQLRIRARDDGDPDGGLVRAARRGDRQAFDALVGAYQRPLRGFLARRVGPDVVDDVLQDTWLACWVALPRYAGRARFKAWLFGIAVHKCTDHYRARGRAFPELSSDEAAEAGDPKDHYAAVELKDVVQTALSQLPDTQREVLELYYYAELTLPEIAALLGRNQNTVKYQFYRAHAQAAEFLDESGPQKRSGEQRRQGAKKNDLP